MCKHLRKFVSASDGETRFYCNERGTAYCKMNMAEYPEYAITPHFCKNYEPEVYVKSNRDGVPISDNLEFYMEGKEW